MLYGEVGNSLENAMMEEIAPILSHNVNFMRLAVKAMTAQLNIDIMASVSLISNGWRGWVDHSSMMLEVNEAHPVMELINYGPRTMYIKIHYV